MKLFVSYIKFHFTIILLTVSCHNNISKERDQEPPQKLCGQPKDIGVRIKEVNSIGPPMGMLRLCTEHKKHGGYNRDFPYPLLYPQFN